MLPEEKLITHPELAKIIAARLSIPVIDLVAHGNSRRDRGHSSN